VNRRDNRTTWSFSHTAHAAYQELGEEPRVAEETIPASAFAHASTLQAATRYLIDVRGLSFTVAARVLGRSVKTVWASYHQTVALAPLAESLPVPASIFRTDKAPLEALVLYLKRQGLRNVEIARLLRLDPRTTWTAAKRGEARA
jgi:DNA-directed RNA polymerase specialized sigma24 family protein